MNMGDIFAEEEARMAAEARAELAREDAAWAALPQAEQDRISAAREARLAGLFDAHGSGDDDEADDDE